MQEPRLKFIKGQAKVEHSNTTTQRLMRVQTEDSEDQVPYNKWTLLMALFVKYGIAPVVLCLFAFWLQEKDKQIMVMNDKQVQMTERLITVLDANNQAFKDLTHELKEKRNP